MKILGINVDWLNMKNIVKFLYVTSVVQTAAQPFLKSHAEPLVGSRPTIDKAPIDLEDIGEAPDLECQLPSGDWASSCNSESLSLERYRSVADRLLGDRMALCVLNVDCQQDRADHPLVHNEFMFPVGYVPENLSNVNGSLRQDNKPVARVSIQGMPVNPEAQNTPLPAQVENNVPVNSQNQAESPAPAFTCDVPPGSYIKSCDADVKPYVSPDPNINRVANICQAKLVCHDGVKRAEDKPLLVYFNVKAEQGSGELVENCRASLKVDSNDNECHGKSLDEIGKIAESLGEKVVVLGAPRRG